MYEKALERAAPDARAEHQLGRLNGLLQEILPVNRFYAAKLGTLPYDLGWDGFRSLPFTRKAELVEDQALAPPFGTPCRPVPVKPKFVPTPPGTRLPPLRDPFTYDPGRRREFEARAAAGSAHVLYARSPGGAVVTAERVVRFRRQVDAVAKDAGVDANLLEALVFLESAGRDDAVAPQGLEGAAGLTQIVAQTGQDLLGMHVDVGRSARLTRRLDRARSERQAERLRRMRRAVDERFDPAKALAATGRYLKIAEQKFGSEEFAFVSYHMGMGNLDGVLRAYAGGDVPDGLRYAQVYFDSSPTRHADAWSRLAGLGDDSSNYLWKLYAARDIMRLYRTDPHDLQTMNRLGMDLHRVGRLRQAVKTFEKIEQEAAYGGIGPR